MYQICRIYTATLRSRELESEGAVVWQTTPRRKSAG